MRWPMPPRLVVSSLFPTHLDMVSRHKQPVVNPLIVEGGIGWRCRNPKIAWMITYAEGKPNGRMRKVLRMKIRETAPNRELRPKRNSVVPSFWGYVYRRALVYHQLIISPQVED